MILSTDQIRAFHIQGFLALQEPVVLPEELAWLTEVYDRLFEARAGRETGDQFDLAGDDQEGTEAKLPQILDPARYAPELNEGKFLKVAREVVQQLLGPEATLGIAQAINKPGKGPETPWHQDEAYWDPAVLPWTLSFWIPLQPVRIENGCMWYMPGSHRWEVLEHQSIGGDPRVHGLELVDLSPIQNPVPCPLPAGGAVIHLGRCAHYAGPNTADEARRALILMGGLPGTAYPTARRFEWNERKETARAAPAEAANKLV